VPLTHPKHRMWLDTVLGYLVNDEAAHFDLLADNSWVRSGAPGLTVDAQRKLYDWVVQTQVRQSG
jgi:hypothetical protein